MNLKQFKFLIIPILLLLVLAAIILLMNNHFFENYNYELFNNIVTPIATIFSALLFVFSLILIQNQSHIANSGFFLSTLLERATRLKERGLAWDFHYHYPDEMKRLKVHWKPNLINCAQVVDAIGADIACSKIYHNFEALIRSNSSITINDFSEKTKGGGIFWAINSKSADIFKDIAKFHQNTFHLIKEIKTSPNLIKSHKDILIDFLTNDMLDEYLSYCDVLINGSRQLLVNIKIPNYKKSQTSGILETEGLLEQWEFINLYNYLVASSIIPKNRTRGLIEQHTY